MKTFQEDSNNDLFIANNGLLSIVTDSVNNPIAIGQVCVSAVEAQLGEMLYQADQGMPMFETAFNTYLPKQFEAAARTVILGVPGVVQVTSFSVSQVGETLTYTATIQTIYGETSING